MGIDLGQCALMVTFNADSLGGLQHHDLLSHSVALSWNWVNQYLPYPNSDQVFENCEVQIQTGNLQIPRSSKIGGDCSTHLATPTGCGQRVPLLYGASCSVRLVPVLYTRGRHRLLLAANWGIPGQAGLIAVGRCLHASCLYSPRLTRRQPSQVMFHQHDTHLGWLIAEVLQAGNI